jgi:hypothetical protein
MMAEAAGAGVQSRGTARQGVLRRMLLEGQAKGHWSMEAVEQAKRRAGW